MFISFVSEVSTLGPSVSKVQIYSNCCILMGVLICVYLSSVVISYWVLHEIIFPSFKIGKAHKFEKAEDDQKLLKLHELDWEDILERVEKYLRIKIEAMKLEKLQRLITQKLQLWSVVCLILILCILAATYSLWFTFIIAGFVFLIDSSVKLRIYEYFGRRLYRLKQLDNYELINHKDTLPENMTKYELKELKQVESYKLNLWLYVSTTYILMLFMLIFTRPGHYLLETSLELLIRIFDSLNLDIHIF